jgi:hypothetical protein
MTNRADESRTADEEIARQIALKVMKWIPDDDCPRGYRPFWHTEDPNVDGPDYEHWDPVNNIAQAWQVLEKFPAPDYHVSIFNIWNGWGCDITNTNTLKKTVTGTRTSPKAICLAALKTLESN